jgi:WS/DGAT/MGAT family acyltransferase
MQQLSGLDASFLYLETYKSPMHIGGVYIFEPPQEGEMSFQSFKNYIESRLHTSRVFRRRLVETPLNLGHPYWIEDPEFNLNNHLYHIALPKPGYLRQLRDAASLIFSRRMDRDKPLWEITFVEGLHDKSLPKGSFAIITKIHHAAIDGMSGAEMMGALLSMSPTPEHSKPTPWYPDKLPTTFELLSQSAWQTFGTPIQIAKIAIDTISNAISTIKEVAEKSLAPPPLPFTAPMTPFNVSITANRTFGGIEIQIADLKEIKTAMPGSTINDIVLAICAGALRSYLQNNKQLPKKSLVAMAPISTRTDEEKKAGGNQVSAMLVYLATLEENPVRRLSLIMESARNSKAYSKALAARQLMDLVPSAVAALGARLYTSMKLSETHSPFYNLVITNVPGPPMPLYMNGAKLRSHFGTAPILDGLGLLMVVFSYAGVMTISATSTPEIIPDIAEFLKGLHQSKDELYNALLKKTEKKTK